MKFKDKGDYCTAAPDHFLKYNWNLCCYHHDRQYRNEVKHRKTRKQADIDLRNCMKRRLPKYLGFIAWTYYWAVRLFSEKFWIK